MTTAVSIVDSSVYAIPINIFQDRLAASPALNQAVLQILCRKNSLLVGHLLSHSSSDSLQRIAQVLLDMVHAYGTETESGCEISIRFSHQDVANLLHISRATVTKAFQTMSQEGILRRNQGHILICDRNRSPSQNRPIRIGSWFCASFLQSCTYSIWEARPDLFTIFPSKYAKAGIRNRVPAFYRGICFLLALIGAIQERHDLRARAVRVGAERRVGSTVRHVIRNRPVNRISVERVGLHVGEVRTAARGALEHTVQERHALAAGAGRVGRKGRLGHAVCDAVFDRPGDGFGVISTRRNVREAACRLRLGAAGGTPQERDDLTARAGLIGSKQRCAHAVGHAVLDRPLDRVIVVGRGRNVAELDGLLRRRLRRGLRRHGGGTAVTAGNGNFTSGRLVVIVAVCRAGVAERKGVSCCAVRQRSGIRTVLVLRHADAVIARHSRRTLAAGHTTDGQCDLADAAQGSGRGGDGQCRRSLDDVERGRADNGIAHLDRGGSCADVGIAAVFDRIFSITNYFTILGDLDGGFQSRTGVSLVGDNGRNEVGIFINHLAPLRIDGIRHVIVDVLTDLIGLLANSIASPLLEGVAITCKLGIVNFNDITNLASIISTRELDRLGFS